MSPSISALLAQLAPRPGDRAANLAALAAALEAHPEVELAVLPELFLSGYGPDAVAAAGCGADELTPVRELAARHATAVVVGFAERADGVVYDAMACVDRDGALAGVYRKTHLFDGERDVFAAGDELLLCELAGRRVGILNCMDIEFPEPARALARAGAELLVTASANMSPYWDCHDLHARARALDNRLAHLYSNRPGAEAGLRFVGGSRAITSDGAVVAECGRDEDELLAVDLDLDRGEPRLDYVALARGPLPVASGHGRSASTAAPSANGVASS
ncbi:nitrilase-related carbon-nitrogen hydrolase [Patulibacter defluvii]|uniref:nitrilase-related carbon-nitrogen hydrolase n=1 Tax=Patulibacter defluvii TaxID=3095358 RepID=UPI002A74CD27|nr:nitrilase-related carbon-nitrogen hydrolase [Patulibacter sp. DM4]